MAATSSYLAYTGRSTTNQTSRAISCPRAGCPGIAPGTAHVESTGGFSCLELPTEVPPPSRPPTRAFNPFDFPAAARPRHR